MKQTVMIIDDNMDKLLVKYLESLNYRVNFYTNSIEGFNNLKANIPDILLLDIAMPFKDGNEILMEIKRHQELNFPVIITTANSSPIKKAFMSEAGADGYFIKPFLYNELIEQMQTCINNYKNRCLN